MTKRQQIIELQKKIITELGKSNSRYCKQIGINISTMKNRKYKSIPKRDTAKLFCIVVENHINRLQTFLDEYKKSI